MQRVTPCPSIPSSGSGRPALALAGLEAIAGPRGALPRGRPVAVLSGPSPAALQRPLEVRPMVAEAGFVRGGQSGTRGGPLAASGGFGLLRSILPHGCSRDPSACEERSKREATSLVRAWRSARPDAGRRAHR